MPKRVDGLELRATYVLPVVQLTDERLPMAGQESMHPSQPHPIVPLGPIPGRTSRQINDLASRSRQAVSCGPVSE